jgi:hypothetical protein
MSLVKSRRKGYFQILIQLSGLTSRPVTPHIAILSESESSVLIYKGRPRIFAYLFPRMLFPGKANLADLVALGDGFSKFELKLFEAACDSAIARHGDIT